MFLNNDLKELGIKRLLKKKVMHVVMNLLTGNLVIQTWHLLSQKAYELWTLTETSLNPLFLTFPSS